MQYSPKLKKAMKEINAIMFKEGIGGVVVLHTPGFSEYNVRIQPPYSCAKLDGDKIHFKCKAADYKNNAAVRDERIANTSNMFHLLSHTIATIAVNLIEVSEQFDLKIQAEHEGFTHVSQIDLDN